MLNALFSFIGTTKPQSAQVLPVVIFMAFCVKAYINNLGYRHIENWPEIEKKKWSKKIKLLHKTQSIHPDWQGKELSFATELFSLRDRLAHGKPERVEGKTFDSLAKAQEHIVSSDFEPSWFKSLDSKWYVEAQRKFSQLMEYLVRLHKLSPTDYYHASTNTFCVADDQ